MTVYAPSTAALRLPAPRRLAWTVLATGVAAALALSAAWAIAGPVHGQQPHVRLASPSPPLPDVIAARAPVPALAAPAAGTTGTIDLPALPAAALLVPEPALPVAAPAAPFRSGPASRLDRGRALECLTAAIYYEAASEPDAGQQAVAQVVLNRARHPAFPGTVCGVVYQGSERAGCQFSFACDGAMVRHRPSAAGWARAARVAALALAGRVYAPVGLATHYHTYAVTPAWNRALVMTDAVGAHLFHRWKGWWGTPAAFARHYAGGEPVPGPHLPPPAPLFPSPTPVMALAAPVPPAPVVTAAAAIQPAYRASGIARAAPLAGDDRLPPAATILPQWQESGRPLR